MMLPCRGVLVTHPGVRSTLWVQYIDRSCGTALVSVAVNVTPHLETHNQLLIMYLVVKRIIVGLSNQLSTLCQYICVG